ncbi:3-deoxy-D-manno-octulosonic acid transferase [Sneathiella marina]|uniref:3-deoxy-D-manno-octulosonic acid transferase n=1 Tax=Sneathiella marina TaxID=2950108 RepID=A0ABY4VZA9_9PROT|nr:3-deoxy-D-manno-octulosonic acid transferase [Sneathiella marina]USG60210.1 3-deoxy-D-manno-octulosonic acid transferase [Sneathiella marina]
MYMALYNGVLCLASPLISQHMSRRLRSGKEDVARYSERLGTPSVARPEGELVWIHAASVGEAISALSLVDGLLESTPDRHILVTTGTRTSAEIMCERLPTRAFHQYVPIDKKEYVARFLEYWRPDAGLWMESEIWPNLIRETASRQIPTMLVNARITDKSFRKWRRFSGFSRLLFSSFESCTAQSEISADRLRRLGARDVEYLGNLKFAADPLPVDEEALAALSESTRDHQLWLAASTHPGEDEQIVEVHKILSQVMSDLLTVIVPRHPERGDEIVEMASRLGFNTVQRSRDEKITVSTDIYVADTIGELGLFYRLADVVFIGGSLVEKGGQNPMEAARLDCAILHGPHMENFSEVTAEFKAGSGEVEIRNAPELSKAVATYLTNQAKREKIAGNAKNVASKGTEICATIVAKVDHKLKERRS